MYFEGKNMFLHIIVKSFDEGGFNSKSRTLATGATTPQPPLMILVAGIRIETKLRYTR